MRRNDLDICADILVVAKRGAKKTHIVYRANLNFNLVTKYLRRLIKNGLLRPASEKNVYTTTDEGIDFLEQYRKLNTPLRRRAGLSRSIWRSRGLSNVVSTLIIMVTMLLATVATLPLTSP